MSQIKKKINYLEQWFDFGEQSPPLPVSEFEICSTVSLYDSDSTELLKAFLVVTPGEHASSVSLESDDNL